MSFGEKLQELRKRNGLTQESFAEQLCVSRQAVSKWESGKGYPEMEKLLFLCECYGVTLDELFGAELPEKEAEQPPRRPGKPLMQSLGDFYTNLAPYDKFVIVALTFVCLLGLIALGHALGSGKGGNMTLVWIAMIIAFGVAEAVTAGLVSIWFVAGGVAALVSAELGAALWLQVVVFLAVSIAALIATRPLAKKMLDKTVVPTNADRVLRAKGRVVEEIRNENALGAVYVDGKTWSARSEDGSVIAKDTMVTVVRMEGVKLFVKVEKEEQ